jgi:hypothetical protein
MVVAAVAAACGGDSKTVKIPGGGEVSVSDKVPGDFPKDYPVYKGAKVTGSLTGSSKGITGTTVTWETGDSLDKVTAFYADAFKSGAWKSDSTGQLNDSSFWTGDSSDGKKSHYLMVSKAGDKTTIIVTVGDKQGDTSSSDTPTSGGSTSKTATGGSSSGSSKTATASAESSSKTPESSPLPPEVKLSKDFPTDRVPLPSGARVTGSSSFGQGGSKTYIIEFYTKDSPENVADYFSNEMPKHGWSDAFSSNSNGDYFVTFTAGDASASSNDGMTAAASASESAGYTKVGVTVSLTGTP